MAGKLLLSAAIAALASATSALPDPGSAMSVASPDGRVTCEFALEDGLPVADVSFRDKRVFRMALGIECGKTQIIKSEKRTVRSSWKPTWGFRSEYPENYAELVVKLVRNGRKGKETPAETLYLRCYDEGFAVRTKFVMSQYTPACLSGERTSWRFAEGAEAWGITKTEAT